MRQNPRNLFPSDSLQCYKWVGFIIYVCMLPLNPPDSFFFFLNTNVNLKQYIWERFK